MSTLTAATAHPLSAVPMYFETLALQVGEYHRLGESYSSFFCEARPTICAFDNASVEGCIRSAIIPTPAVDLQFHVCETWKHVAEKLSLSAELEGVAKYALERDLDSRTLLAVVAAKYHTRTAVLLPSVQLNKDAALALENPEHFVFTYGDYYSSEVTYGGEFYALLWLKTTSTAEKSHLATSLDTAWAIGHASGSFSRDFDTLTKNLEQQVKINVIGATESPKTNDIETILSFAQTRLPQLLTNSVTAVHVRYTPFVVLQANIDKLQALAAYLKLPLQNMADLRKWLEQYSDVVSLSDIAKHNETSKLSAAGVAALKTLQGGIRADMEAACTERDSKKAYPHEIRSPQKFLATSPDSYASQLSAISNRYAQRVLTTDSHGGNGGAPFKDILYGVDRITELRVRWGALIDAIQSVWSDVDGGLIDGAQHGGGAAACQLSNWMPMNT